MLIVGDGPIASITAGFLERAGVDPVIASPPRTRSQPTVWLLGEQGLEPLSVLGLRRPIEQISTPVTQLRRPRAGETWQHTESERSSNPIAVDRSRLDTLLTATLRDRITTTDRSVTAVEPVDTGVSVQFDQSVTEAFDAVVTTVPSMLPMEQPVSQTATVHRWEFAAPNCHTAQTAATEAWTDHKAAFVTPLSDESRVQLVATPQATPESVLSVDELADRFGELFPETDPFRGLDQRDIRYSQTDRVAPRSRISDQIALIGPATRATLPADGISPTLSIEDSIALADSLTYGLPDINSALDKYEQRRRQRDQHVRAYVGSTTNAPAAFHRLYARRHLVFANLIGENIPRFAPITVDISI